MCEMKHSGVEWIGKIPSQWKICRLKNYARIINGQDYQTVIADDGQYPVIGSGGPFARANAYLYDVESVLLGRKGTIDKPIYINRPFWTVDTMYYTEIQDTAFGKYLYYLCTQIEFGYYQYGSAVPSMTQRDLNNVRFPMPTIQEQQRIADYLDVKCTKIDALIAKQQEIIEKLKAYKLSVITEAVTKGLNPTVPMKDSGVEWIGEIPVHWFIHKFCWNYSAMLGKMLDAKRISGENLHPYIKNVNVQWFHIDYDNLDQMDFEENEAERYSVQAGDLMICEGGEIGKCAIVPDDFPQGIYYQKALHRVRRRTENSGNIEFLSYLMFCMAKNECFDTSPEKATIAHLPGDALSQLRLPAPPIEEQKNIVRFLNQKCQQIEKAISTKQQIIDKLTEYKKSLIYEVVTGKREV